MKRMVAETKTTAEAEKTRRAVRKRAKTGEQLIGLRSGKCHRKAVWFKIWRCHRKAVWFEFWRVSSIGRLT